MVKLTDIWGRPEDRARLHQELGQFIFEFSHLEFSIRSTLACALKLDDELIDTVTSPYDFRVLCAVTENVVAFKAKASDADRRKIHRLFAACLKLNEKRVHVAHGLWDIDGQGSRTRHVSRTDLKAKTLFDEPGSLKRAIGEINVLHHEIVQVLRFFFEDEDDFSSVLT